MCGSTSARKSYTCKKQNKTATLFLKKVQPNVTSQCFNCRVSEAICDCERSETNKALV